jgi:hypothetical protein
MMTIPKIVCLYFSPSSTVRFTKRLIGNSD